MMKWDPAPLMNHGTSSGRVVRCRLVRTLIRLGVRGRVRWYEDRSAMTDVGPAADAGDLVYQTSGL